MTIEGCAINHSNWCVETAAREALELESALRELQKVDKKEAEKLRDDEARNLACASLSFKILENGRLAFEKTIDLRAPYRPYRLGNALNDTIFVSSETTEFLSHFDGLKPISDTDKLSLYIYKWKKFNQDREDEKKKKDLIVGTPFMKVFNIPDPTGGLYKQFDDTEQQIIRELEERYPEVLEKFLDDFTTYHWHNHDFYGEDSKITMIVSSLLHTKMDPCPFCLNRMNEYFQKSFQQTTEECIRKILDF